MVMKKIILPSVVSEYEKLSPSNKQIVIPVLKEIFDTFQIKKEQALWIYSTSEQWRVEPPKNKISKHYRDLQYQDLSQRINALNILLNLKILTASPNLTILGPYSPSSNTKVFKLKINPDELIQLIGYIDPSFIIDSKNIKYRITFDEGTIRLNEKYLSKPIIGEENARFFKYVFDNPDIPLTANAIREAIGGKSIGKDFHKIIENLNFTGNLKKAFFKIKTKDKIQTIIFRNPITKLHLQQLRIRSLPLHQK